MNKLEYFLQNSSLSEELKTVLKEAWEEKIEQTKKELEDKVRKELSERYEVDKNRLIDSIEKFLVENLQKELTVLNREKRLLYEKINKMQEKLMNDIKDGMLILKEGKQKLENRKNMIDDKVKKEKEKVEKNFKNKLDEFIKFADKKLTEEIKELREDLQNLKKEKMMMQEKLRRARLEYKRVYEERINKIERFLIKQLAEELAEFNKDRKMLEERRVELEAKALEKISEARKMFVEKASKLIDHIVNKEMTRELTQLKEDIILAKQNDFGRRIFEAYAFEFMSSHLMENTEMAKLRKKIDESNKVIENLKSQLLEQKQALNKSKREVLLLKEEIKREKIMSNLLAPLSPKQRKVMANLLEGVKTENLQEQFKRYLPNVLEEVPVKNNLKEKELINESNSIPKVVTGDRNNLINDFEEREEQNVVIELKKLAGIN